MAAKHKNVGYDVVGHIPLRILVPFLSLLPAISITLPAMGAEIQTKSCPLAFHVDLVYYLPTSLYIKCDVKEYNMPFLDFSSKESGPAESRFKELVSAIRENNLKKCLSMTFRGPWMNEEQMRPFDQRVEAWTSMWHKALASEKIEKLNIFCQFYLGDSRLFILGGDSNSVPSQPFRWQLRLRPTVERTFSWNIEDPDPLQSLLGDAVRQTAISPTKFVAVENTKFEYEVPIPDTNDTQHITYLQFNGQKYNFKVFSDAMGPVAKPTDEVLSLFQQQYLLIAGGSPREALASFYTDESRNKYVEWIKKTDSKYLDWYFNDMATRERTVRFVVDADPLYIVLFKVQGHSPLFHKFIVRDPKDGKLKFTNFLCSGFLDGLFINEQFRGFLSERIGIK
jgi:hypothetical protein